MKIKIANQHNQHYYIKLLTLKDISVLRESLPLPDLCKSGRDKRLRDQRFIDLNTMSNYHTFFCRIEDNGSGQTAENVKVEFYVSLTLRGSRW